ncbi:hypothetical protein Cgig2_000933 [Carnegiea gigantea]|uniref:Receptor-like serine/threonine-protein kinase n=1 Tax=Carnegiea gigantea TaxID=171969 RepID=A0A9Q1KNT5_9CARY|nr:hypothetical protein Cgig2_000933 [Carnegiea gigantea]
MRATSYDHLLIWPVMFLMVIKCDALDVVNVTQIIRDGDTLVSAGARFVLGFFSPGSSSRRYVGIWFNRIPVQTVVWVANRETPLLDSSGVLQVTNKSVLTLVNGTGGVIWSTNTSKFVRNPIAQLLGTGNLVVRDQNDNSPQNFLWQSFDHPCDTQLPGMKLGRDLVTGFDRMLTSWKSSDDPSPGSYTYRIDPRGYPQPFLWKDSIEQFRDGPWDGMWFSGSAITQVDSSDSFQFVLNDKEIYYSYNELDPSVITTRALNTYGSIQRHEWNNHTQGWAAYYTKPIDNCDTYAVCGAFGICNFGNSPQCQCMKGFVPKMSRNWDEKDWTGGCVYGAPWNCSIRDGFIKYSNVKLPDTRNSWYDTTMNLDQCKMKCLHNCSCVAFANLDVRDGGSGCLLWINSLIDVRVISGAGEDLYVRVASSELGGGRNRVIVAVSCSLVAALFLCGITISIMWRRRRWKIKEQAKYGAPEEGRSINIRKMGESELPEYAFDVIAEATNNFSLANRLGEGGFGPVYKGVLNDGQVIAVKRLSKESRQGLAEFKNEVIFISKLQHRNLVKLMGCCIEAEERMLIYEYMPNKSLDYFIFDQSSSALLGWPKRLEIIKGIARGLLYLHQDSRLRIVHRDLKASNVLLDFEMNPKISDFGLARTFNGNEDAARTKRVVGTYGYMPPEYAIDGVFSLKSDVFSFGVLVLEILSGKRNRGFIHLDHHHSLLGHAWMLFREGATLEVVDPSIRNSSYASQMERSIQMGLLCVQQHPDDRPSISLVNVMLTSDCELPEPKEPGFYIQRNVPHESASSRTKSISNDQMTITTLHGR